MSQMKSYIFHPFSTEEVKVKKALHQSRQQELLRRLEAARQNSQYSVNTAKINMNSL